MPLITLVSSDGKQFQAEASIFKHSAVLNGLIEDLNLDIDSNASAFPIPIRKVTGDVLEKVIEWCTYHKDDPVERLLTEADLMKWGVKRSLPERANAFIQALDGGRPISAVCDLMAAANELLIPLLFDQCKIFS